MLDHWINRISVLGAAGKMGSGIALLLLQEMARVEAENTGTVGKSSRLVLIDSNETALDSLPEFFRTHLTKYAERNINALRRYFEENPKLVSNREMIEYFVNGALNPVRLETQVESAKQSKLIFEAVVEDEEVKSKVFAKLADLVSPETYFFTNTSSIPIHILSKKGHLQNRLIGFHFYNPPYVQKLLEVIVPSECNPQLISLAKELAVRLKKTIVFSNDVAGFIGNGHFIREIIYACEKVHELLITHTIPQAIYVVNKVTQDFLIRPMGIFQLMDYVGIDVCQKICQTMSAYLPNELFKSPLIDVMIESDVLGGQFPDGSQKNGYFQYDKGKRIGIYSPNERLYSPFEDFETAACDKELGDFPKGHASWKHFQRDPDSDNKIQEYLQNLKSKNSPGAELAQKFLIKSAEIAQQLVNEGVTKTVADVDTVLKNGFFHLY
jgi:3-hydroxyacyl-CoA dehydrogenase